MSETPLSTENAKKATVDEILSRLSATKEGRSSLVAEKRLERAPYVNRTENSSLCNGQLQLIKA